MKRHSSSADHVALFKWSQAMLSGAFLLLLLLFVSSCRDSIFDRQQPHHDGSDPHECEVAEGKTYEVAVPFAVPAAGEASSLRALARRDIADENNIQNNRDALNVRAFVFTEVGSDYTFTYEASVTKVEPNEANNKQNGKLTLLIKDSGDSNQKIVFVTSAGNLDGTLPATGTKLADFYTAFTFKTEVLTSPDRDLPMYAETQPFKYNHSANAPVSSIQESPIYFLRAVARVDVFMGTLDDSAKQFDETATDLKRADGKPIQLRSVEFFNAERSGFVIPNLDNVSGRATQTVKVTAPTPTSDPSKPDWAPYTDAGTKLRVDFAETDRDNFVKRQLYIPESLNEPKGASYPPANPGETRPALTPEQQSAYMKRPYMVVGIVGAVPEKADKVTYFRIDFLKRTGEEATATYEYLPLLRNYRYLVNIKAVNGPGFDTPEEAAQGPAANIMYNVVVWSESEMSDVKYDGQYMLGVSSDQIVGFRSGGNYPLEIQTSWPKGWHIEPNEHTPDFLRTLLVSQKPDGTIEYNFKSKPGEETQKSVFQLPMAACTEEEWNGYVNPSLDPKQVRKEVPTGEYAGQEGNYSTFDVVAGRMRWTIHAYQLQEFRISARVYSDPECTQALQFLQIHELGKSLAPDATRYTGTNPEIDAKYKGEWRNESGQTIDGFGFTGDEAGATRYFYVKYEGPADKKIEVAPVDGTARFEVAEVPDPTLNEKNIYKYSVTADEMVDHDNLFETRLQEFEVVASSLSMNVTSKPSKVTFNQTEYNVYPFHDKLGVWPIQDEYSIRMDGKARDFFIKANADYTVRITSQKGTEGLTTASMDKSKSNELLQKFAVTKFAIGEGTSKKEIVYSQPYGSAAYSGVPDVNGVPFQMTVVDDIKEPSLFWARVDWEFAIDETAYPYHNYKVRVDNFNYISAFIVPEANSYPIELGGAGVLIPLSQINKAADTYNSKVIRPSDWDHDQRAKDTNWESNWDNWIARHRLNNLDEDDEPTVEVLWCDAKSTTNPARKPVNADGSTPIKFMSVVGRYVILFPGESSEENQANVVVGIRSSKHTRVSERFSPEANNGKKALLWSFHLMFFKKNMVPKGLYKVGTSVAIPPATNLIQYFYEGSEAQNFPYDPISWPLDLGALTKPVKKNGSGDYSYLDPSYRTIGLGYQFGRKDPFPFTKNATGAPTMFVDHEGRQVKFYYDQTQSTMSMRESIENPMALCATDGRWQWMTEGQRSGGGVRTMADQSAWQIRDIWGGGMPIGAPAHRKDNANYTQKTPFDPSPYGFCVPASGAQSTGIVHGTKHSIANLTAFGGNVVRRLGLNMSVTNNNDLCFEGIFAGAGTVGTYTAYAVSNIYYLDNNYPCYTVALKTNDMNNAYNHYTRKADLLQVRPFVNLDNLIKDDYMLYLPPYTESYVPPIEDRSRSF